MIRIRGAIPVLLMASVTGSRQRCVVVVDVALHTGNACVSSCQWEYRGVIECCRRPARGGVALCAIGWETGRDVVWICRTCEIGLVAGIAICGRALVHVVDVAVSTQESGMHSGQRIPRELQVIKLRVEPRVHRMAAFARCRKACRHMIEYGSLKILLVAAVACR